MFSVPTEKNCQKLNWKYITRGSSHSKFRVENAGHSMCGSFCNTNDIVCAVGLLMAKSAVFPV